MMELSQLITDIKLANNGYIYNPSGVQLDCAANNPLTVKLWKGSIVLINYEPEYYPIPFCKPAKIASSGFYDYEGAILARQEND